MDSMSGIHIDLSLPSINTVVHNSKLLFDYRCANTCNAIAKWFILLVCNFAAVCSLTLLCGCFYIYILFYCTFFFYLIWALPEINVIVLNCKYNFCFNFSEHLVPVSAAVNEDITSK